MAGGKYGIVKQKAKTVDRKSNETSLGQIGRYKNNGTVTELNELQQRFGFSYSEASWLVALGLDIPIIEICMYDWMHLYFVQAICYGETNVLLAGLNTCDLGFESIGIYSDLWTWPKTYTCGKTIVHKDNANGPASELMSLVPVLLRYLQIAAPKEKCLGHVASLIALCLVVEMLNHHSSTPPGRIAPGDLKNAVFDHLSLHLAIYGNANGLAKFHWVSHLDEFLERFGKHVACFLFGERTPHFAPPFRKQNIKDWF